MTSACRTQDTAVADATATASANQIGHPNIVDVFAFGALPDGRQYMVMEWLRGESLSDRLHRGVPSLADSCDILLGVGAALDAAHEKGIIHRDLKPHNVFLVEVKNAKPLVKLLDFGLVKLTGPEDDGRIERTRSGSVLGTPAYMSPEQALGRSVDTRSDNYSFGVLAFQMFTGRLPFSEDTAMGLMVAHMQQPPTLPSSVAPNIAPEIDQLVLGLLAKDPNHRPSMAQAMEMLAFIRDSYGPGHRSGSLPPRPNLPLPAPAPSHAPSAPTWSPPNKSQATTLGGQSQGEQLLTARHEPSSSKKWPVIAGGLIAVSAVVIALIVRGGGEGRDTAGSAPPADAAVAPPPVAPPDAAVVAVPVDAAPVAVAPPDAAEVVVAPDAGAAVVPAKKPAKPPKPPKPPKPGDVTPPKPPPPDDDDGLLPVAPKKK